MLGAMASAAKTYAGLKKKAKKAAKKKTKKKPVNKLPVSRKPGAKRKAKKLSSLAGRIAAKMDRKK